MKKDKKKENKNAKIIPFIAPSDADPMGMYTGKPVGEDLQPVQDSDDL